MQRLRILFAKTLRHNQVLGQKNDSSEESMDPFMELINTLASLAQAVMTRIARQHKRNTATSIGIHERDDYIIRCLVSVQNGGEEEARRSFVVSALAEG